MDLHFDFYKNDEVVYHFLVSGFKVLTISVTDVHNETTGIAEIVISDCHFKIRSEVA